MNTYVALLRGINLGARRIKMSELSDVFDQLGYDDVRTILASGNVIFGSSESSIEVLKSDISRAMKERFGFDTVMQIVPLKALVDLVEHNPFANLVPSPATHWYVTFLETAPADLGIFDATAGIKFVEARGRMLCYTLDKRSSQTTDFMTMLDKSYGRSTTTRNWNTIVKISR